MSSKNGSAYPIPVDEVLRRIKLASQDSSKIRNDFSTALYIAGATDEDRALNKTDRDRQLGELLEPAELQDAAIIGIVSEGMGGELVNLLVIDPRDRYEPSCVPNGTVIYRDGRCGPLVVRPASEVIPKMLEANPIEVVSGSMQDFMKLGMVPYRIRREKTN